jgi:hypothetical protein
MIITRAVLIMSQAVSPVLISGFGAVPASAAMVQCAAAITNPVPINANPFFNHLLFITVFPFCLFGRRHPFADGMPTVEN